MLSFDQLHAFQKVVAAGTFSRAAEQLFLTQAAVSQRIRYLEQTLGVELFDRHIRGRPPALTPAGERLLSFANEVQSLLEQLKLDIGSGGAVGKADTLAIACGPATSQHLIPSLLGAYHEAFPSVRVTLHHCFGPAVKETVLRGEADIGIQLRAFTDERVRVAHLLTDALVLVAPANHPITRASVVDLHELQSLDFVVPPLGTNTRSLVEDWASSINLRLKIALESSSFDALKESVVHGLGLTILPTFMVAKELEAGLLTTVKTKNLPQDQEYCFISDARRKLPVAARRLVEVAAKGAWQSRL